MIMIFRIQLNAFTIEFVTHFRLRTEFFRIMITANSTTNTNLRARFRALSRQLINSRTTTLRVHNKLTRFQRRNLIITRRRRVALEHILRIMIGTFFFARTLSRIRINFIMLRTVITIKTNFIRLRTMNITLSPIFFRSRHSSFQHQRLLMSTLINTIVRMLRIQRRKSFMTHRTFTNVTLDSTVSLTIST